MLNGFERRFERFTTRLERFLIKAVLLGIALLVVVQVALTNESARTFLNYGATLTGADPETLELLRQESESVPAMAEFSSVSSKEVPTRSKGQVMVKLQDHITLDYAKIIVNGKVVASFNQNPVMLEVRDGDTIKVDGSVYQMPLRIEVIKVSANVISPPVGHWVETNGGIAELGSISIDE